MSYFAELTYTMTTLSHQPNTVFIGQGLRSGTTMSKTFEHVSDDQLIEMPIAEEMYMGMAIGMALQGLLPIVIIPRWNFMLRAADQIINHLDRLPIYSGGGYKPKVIIRTAVPSTLPFNPQSQHDDDFSAPFREMLRTVHVADLTSEAMIPMAYRLAFDSPDSWIMSEFTDLYRNERANG